MGLSIWQHVYLYDGYTYTAVLTTICAVCMFVGTIIYIIGLVLGIRKGMTTLKRNILAIIACVLCFICVCVCLGYGIDAIDNDDSSSVRDTDVGRDELSAYEYALLYLNISNVRIEQGCSYTYCTGTITNLGYYSVRYIKAMGGFTNYSRSVIDTD